MRWFCAQIGAREHYAVARALRHAGRPVTLCTDFWAGAGLRHLWAQSRKLKWENRNGKVIGALRSLASRWHPELEDRQQTKDHGPRITDQGSGRPFQLSESQLSKYENARSRQSGVNGPGSVVSSPTVQVRSWNLRAMWWEAVKKAENRHAKAKSRKQKAETENISQLSAFSVSAFSPYGGFIEVGHRFAIRVREELKRQNLNGETAVFYAYDTGALEAFEWCREHGVKCVLNQMDPNRVEVELVQAEEKQWPGWALQPVQVPEAYFVRREREWALADRIVVNSEFSRRALMAQGVPAEKLVVIPLCFEAKAESRKQKAETGNQFQLSTFQISDLSPLRVLFLGQVILRKGIQYLLAAAKLLEKENIRFDVVGPIGISQEAMASAPGNVTFHGRAGRDQAADWYRQADVFVLPTLSDGFAITQLEAMAYGLPVVTTPCCGEVVNDGQNGFVVAERDPASLAAAFQRYLGEPELLRAHSVAALARSKQFSLDHLAAHLVKLEAELR